MNRSPLIVDGRPRGFVGAARNVLSSAGKIVGPDLARPGSLAALPGWEGSSYGVEIYVGRLEARAHMSLRRDGVDVGFLVATYDLHPSIALRELDLKMVEWELPPKGMNTAICSNIGRQLSRALARRERSPRDLKEWSQSTATWLRNEFGNERPGRPPDDESLWAHRAYVASSAPKGRHTKHLKEFFFVSYPTARSWVEKMQGKKKGMWKGNPLLVATGKPNAPTVLLTDLGRELVDANYQQDWEHDEMR